VASAVEEGFTADQTRVQATVWKVALDPDGVEGDAEEAMRHRALTRLGTWGGLVRYRMELMPEISGKLEQAITAVVSPKSKPAFLPGDQPADGGLDDRSSPQRRHDAFASLIDAAARSAEVASMGGAAPTVLVTVDEHDLREGRGAGWMDGVDEPIPMAAVTQFACAGGIQKLLMREGRIVSLWSPQRCFTPQQRRAIAARDRGCVIPGCRIPASWCEIHHVVEHSKGGPTETGNGVALRLSRESSGRWGCGIW
ncbi:HNH endonuclease signature motif containing protein, partial [Humibacter ginsengiterrae]